MNQHRESKPSGRILVVEDDPEIAGLIRSTLEREGFEVLVCGDGVGAIAQYQSWQPMAIVLDWMLPGLDGLEVCARIRQQPGPVDPFILLMTARGEGLEQAAAGNRLRVLLLALRLLRLGDGRRRCIGVW